MFDLRPYRDNNAKLSDYLPWAALIAPGIVLNKDGAFQRTAMFRGPDLDSSTPSELMGVSARLNNALRRFGSGWCLHVEARRAPAPGYPDGAWPDALSWLIDEERRAVFEAAGARFESRYFFTLTWLPPAERQTKMEGFLFEGGAEAGPQIDYRHHLERYGQETDALLALLETFCPEARWLSDEETLTYLHDCISDRPHRVAKPHTPFHLDALLSDAPLLGGLSPMLGAHHLKVISVRSFVTETEPGLLDALNRLPLSYRWVSRFIPLDREDARRELERIRKRWFSKRKGLLTLLREALFREEALLVDNDAANQAEDADHALQELGADAVSAGFATLTIIVADADEEAANEAVRQIQQFTDSLGFVTQVEAQAEAEVDGRTIVLVKPQAANLRTNIVLVTSRRTYTIEAVAQTGQAYSAEIAWCYPERAAPTANVGDLQFSYRIRTTRGQRPAWLPTRVFDDGRRTWIEMPPQAASTDLPPLFIITGEGVELVNYRLQGDRYMVDRVFDVAELRLGTRAPVIVRIERERADSPPARWIGRP